ncbi:unnamed protein product [Cuscuta europaea]|uniref:Uncharacterized protein n=1 Tax=Cuscuta europaea TaxID=41803 RepID=A0A9P1EJ93_CUSEU|nr:unnamed protein product [Cuscuta europaea]
MSIIIIKTLFILGKSFLYTYVHQKSTFINTPKFFYIKIHSKVILGIKSQNISPIFLKFVVTPNSTHSKFTLNHRMHNKHIIRANNFGLTKKLTLSPDAPNSLPQF